jgi:uncharacterized protein (TIGR02453 family)
MPFEGFPREGFRFFREIKVNNNREWFQDHKQEYIDYLQDPAVAFIVALGERLKPEFPGITYDTRTNGAGSVMRIYRDIRFAKDKSPYKDHLGVNLWDGPQKKGSPGFHFFMDSNDAVFYGGFHMFPKEYLAAYRDAVADDRSGEEIEKALKQLSQAKDFEVGGEQLKRVPAGYDQDHPRGDLLRYKGMWVKSPPFTREVLESPKLVDVCAKHAHTMGAVHHWFVNVNKAVSP